MEGDELKLREIDRSGGDGQGLGEETEVGTNGKDGIPMEKMSTEGQRVRQRRFQAEVSKDRSMGQAGEMGTERDMEQRRLDGIGQKQRGKTDRGSEVSREGGCEPKKWTEPWERRKWGIWRRGVWSP